MSALSHRDRVLTVLNHETPDRLPIDLGRLPGQRHQSVCLQALKAHLGVPGAVRVQSERSLLAWPDDAILERFDVDLRLVVAHTPEDSGSRGIFDEAAYGKEAEYTDVWGVVRRRPPHGHYYVTHAPFDKEDLTPGGPGCAFVALAEEDRRRRSPPRGGAPPPRDGLRPGGPRPRADLLPRTVHVRLRELARAAQGQSRVLRGAARPGPGDPARHGRGDAEGRRRRRGHPLPGGRLWNPDGPPHLPRHCSGRSSSRGWPA